MHISIQPNSQSAQNARSSLRPKRMVYMDQLGPLPAHNAVGPKYP